MEQTSCISFFYIMAVPILPTGVFASPFLCFVSVCCVILLYHLSLLSSSSPGLEQLARRSFKEHYCSVLNGVALVEHSCLVSAPAYLRAQFKSNQSWYTFDLNCLQFQARRYNMSHLYVFCDTYRTSNNTTRKTITPTRADSLPVKPSLHKNSGSEIWSSLRSVSSPISEAMFNV